jgi:hypothetical protein
MIEGAGTLATIHYAGSQAVQAEADSLRGPNADVVEGKVNPMDRSENMYEESNSQQDGSGLKTANREAQQGQILDILG